MKLDSYSRSRKNIKVNQNMAVSNKKEKRLTALVLFVAALFVCLES